MWTLVQTTWTKPWNNFQPIDMTTCLRKCSKSELKVCTRLVLLLMFSLQLQRTEMTPYHIISNQNTHTHNCPQTHGLSGTHMDRNTYWKIEMRMTSQKSHAISRLEPCNNIMYHRSSFRWLDHGIGMWKNMLSDNAWSSPWWIRE